MILGIDPRPIDTERHRKWINHNDETRGLIGMRIFEDLKFHIHPINIPHEAWLKFE